MAFLDEEFNVDSMPKSTSNFEPLPEGWYNATITGAEVKTTNAGTGKYISCKYTITGPTHQGRVVFGNLNIKIPAPRLRRSDGSNLVRSCEPLVLPKCRTPTN